MKSISTKGLNAQAYIQRAELLNGIFKPVQLKSGALQIDAQCHISTIIEKSMTKHACVYFTKQCSSQHCSLSTQVTREIPFVCTSVAVLQASGIAHLQTTVEEGLNLPESPCLRPIQRSSQCPSAFKTDSTSGTELCAGKVSHSYSLGELLWIDTDLGSNSIEFPLSEFPSNLMLQGERFTLRAVIALKGGLTQDALGHYVAYCRRSSCIWEMYDNLRSGVAGVAEKKQNMPTCSVIHKRLIALFKFNLTSIFVVCHTPLFSHSCLEKLFLLFWKSGLMEFALKSIIVCGTFGLKTDSAAWLVSIKCF